MNEPIKQKIELGLDSSGIPRNSLAALITQLNQVKSALESLDSLISKTNTQLSQTPRKAQEILAQLQKAQATIVQQSSGGKGFSASAIAQVLGADAAAFQKYLSTIKKGVEGYHRTVQQFRTLPTAARAMAAFEAAEYKNLQRRSLSLPALLRPSVSSVHGTGTVKIDGPIALAIPAAQVQASVVGPIQLTIPGEQVVVAGGVRNAAGQFVAGNGAPAAGGGRKKKSGETAYFSPEETATLARGAVVSRRDLVTGKESVTVTELKAAGQTMATTFEKIEGAIKETRQVMRTPGGLNAMQQFRVSRRLLTAGFQRQVLGLSPSDNGTGLSAIYSKQASGLRSLLSPELESAMAPAQAKAVKAELELAAQKLEAQAAAARPRIQGLREVTGADLRKVSAMGSLFPHQLTRDVTGADLAKVQGMGTFGSDIPQSKLSKAFQQGFSAQGFATHLVKVSGWAAAVTTLYKSFELLHYSMERVLDVGMQMSHLSVIFKQQGGSVKELTDDILSLASAQGRSTDEAMESATEWARLQLTRSQMNEAVRVSMVAANVAQMSTTETTKQLMSLMHIYHLQVSDLNSELGKLVYTSQHYNVTLEDLFQGLDRAAPQARQMGMSLGELSGIIAGTVGKTGQSGTVVGNTVKYILQEFNRPQIQQMLRGFGVETTTSQGQIKPAGEILRQLFVSYQGMDTTHRQSLTAELAGRFHGTRFVGMMDSYLESQKLAIDSQLNLNAAQTANLSILDSLQNKLVGLKSEWDRFVYSQATTGSAALGGFTPMDMLTGTIGGATNAMRAFDNSGTSAVTPLAIGGVFGGGMAARAIVGSMLQREATAGAGSSFMLNLGRRLVPAGLRGILGRVAGEAFIPGVGIPLALASLLPSAGGIGRALGGTTDRLGAGEEWARASSIMAARGSAAAGRANLFQTTLDLLGIKNPDATASGNISSAISMSASEMGPGQAAALKRAMASGDMGGARALLTSQIQIQNDQSRRDLAAQAEADKRNVAEKNARIAQLQDQLQPHTMRERNRGGVYSYSAAALTGADADKANQEIADLRGQLEKLNETAQESQQLLEDVEGLPQEALDRRQEYISLLQQQKDLMTGISQLSDQGGLDTAPGHLDSQVRAAQMQVDLAQSTYDRLKTYAETHAEAYPVRDEALQALQQAKATLDSTSSGAMMAQAVELQNRGIVQSRTDISTQGVGFTEAEKLLNQQSILQGDLNAFNNRAPGSMSENDTVRAQREAVDLAKTHEQIQERILQLRKQEQQILIDSNREFQKAMLFAGPGELLQRVFVANIAATRNPSTGEFMSWSPEMRKMYYDLRGGEAGARNREEQGLLGARGPQGNQGLTAEGQQRQAAADRAQVNEWGKRVDKFSTATMGGQTPLPLPFETQAKTAAVQISALGNAALATAGVFKIVTAAMQDFLRSLKNPHGSTPGAQPRVGMSTGFALGSN